MEDKNTSVGNQEAGEMGKELAGESLLSPRPALERAATANKMLAVIASCGRRFFAYKDRVSRFNVDHRGRVWFTDKYTQRRIYTHYKYGWRGFSDGGTLRALVERLRDYIQTGKLLPPTIFGPWPEWVCGGDLWAYGDDMQQVRDAARRFGITAAPERDAETVPD